MAFKPFATGDICHFWLAGDADYVEGRIVAMNKFHGDIVIEIELESGHRETFGYSSVVRWVRLDKKKKRSWKRKSAKVIQVNFK